ncbi:IgA-binding beta antigen [Streptococcus pneumoniae]|nr:RICH domain-containing protein [Streptococcus pneumoniae]CJN02220.1 IgA-binding beta antigen [Streptococcus pneumoniae]CJT15290.1 IgA-binding beta antigen [Streptococcus pneumoniae]CJZ17222.1 IgA-binding beta antigen [Streptococcus pneumoniae]CKB90143.1 IgA-binding beta antigen [Streptococcus pneumoniae]CKD08872.1 IgA-binding beta antigen [Streptococcus pneumoniae]
MFASKSERKVRYSIRKFSIGVASVVVASLFLGGVVHAEGSVPANHPSPQKVSSGDKEYEDVVRKVNIELSEYMDKSLNKLNQSASGFSEILQKVRGVVEGYRKQIDEALNKDGVEKLGEEAKKKIDELVEAFQNNSDNQIPPKKPSQNDGVQGDAPSAGQGKQPGVSNSGDSKPVPPETSGETKPKDSNNSTPPKVENQGGNIDSTEKTTETNLKEAKETAKTTLSAYRVTRLKQENPGAFWFTELLKESEESVEKYKKMFDEASSKEKVENLVKEAEQEIEALVVKHKGREIGLERDKAKKEVTKHLAKLLNDIEKNLEKDQHINTVDLIKNLKDIEKTYLHKLDESTQKAQLQKLVTESKSKLDEALSNFKKGLSSSSSSGSSTKPETPEKPEVKPTPETPEVKPVPQPAPPKPEVKPVPQPAPPKPEVKPVPQPAPPKTSKIFTASNGNTKITVMFETATEADSVNLKEVTTKEMIDNVTRQTGQGTVRIFDISLSKDGKETHVKGERVVRLAIGNIDSEIQVYHVKENGELELLPSTVENGQVVFKTSHFSLFAIKTLPKKQMVVEPEANREGKTQSDDKEMVLLADKANQMSENHSNSDKKDKQALPSTGTMSTLLMEFLGLISLVGVYLLKGKKTEND